MKQAITVLLLIGHVLLKAQHARGQDINKVTISLELKSATLEEAFTKIESLTSFRFNYKTNDIAAIKNITRQWHIATVKKVLTDLLTDAKLQFEQVQQYIVIKRKKDFVLRYVTIYGFVTAVNSGEALIGATVNVSGNKVYTALTNAYGFYSLTVPAGEYVFTSSFIGFRDVEKQINILQTERNNVEMAVNETNLQSVTITAAARK